MTTTLSVALTVPAPEVVVALAVLLIVPVAVVLTTTVMVTLPPAAKEPRVQVGVDELQDPWVVVAETKAIPDGMLSVTTTLLAAAVPGLLTMIV